MRGPLKWYGGKYYLAPKIVALMPRHIHYVEPYFGGGSVLMVKDPLGVSEVVNDLNKDLTVLWAVLRERVLFATFQRMCEVTPFSESVWKQAGKLLTRDDLKLEERAWAFFISCRMSLAGRMTGFAGVTKTRTRRGMNNEVSAWLSAIDGLPEVHTRLKCVLILDSRPALEVIRNHDGPKTLQYLDPPYLHETRATTGEYAHEMTNDDHRDLLRLIKRCKGMIMLSGYRSKMYDEQLKDWERVDFDIPNQAAGGKKKRRMIESVWCNFTVKRSK